MRFWWNRFQIGTGRDDVLFGTDFNDIIFGLGGNDLISTGLGRDYVFAGLGNDSIDTGAGNDRVFAGSGDDEIAGSEGNDTISGGRGFDTVTYLGRVADYDIKTYGRLTFVDSIGPVVDAGLDRLSRVEALYFEADDYTLFINGQNNAVLAGDDTASTDEDTSLVLAAAALLSNDQEFDGDAISITGVDATSAAGAQVSFDGVAVTYDPGAVFDNLQVGESVTDTFSYTVDDGKGGSDTATVTVTVTGVNDGPVLLASDAVVDENTTAVAAGVSASDVDSATLTFALSGVDAGLFDIDAMTGAISFLAAPDFEAPSDADGDNAYDLTVEVSDGDGGLATQDITVTVADVAEFDGRINELHYDNAGGDVGEFVEIRVAAGTDVTNALVELYNGSNGEVYASAGLDAGDLTTDGTFDYYVLDIADFGTSGIQNGAPDGLALSDNGTVIEFLSYEGTLTAMGGVADGLTSTDIGVAENGGTEIGQSLQRNADGTWRAPEAETRGLDNDFVPPFSGRINEFHYDNTSGDVGEFIEVRVDAGADISAVSLELYNGSNGTLYASSALSAGDMTSDGVFDYYVLDIQDLGTSGIQNGSPDGIALIADGAVVEFLSYEGDFTASGGTADGVTSTDIGVSEPGSTPIGFSLQRNEDGTWRAPEEETRGATNDAVAPFAGRINEFHYDNTGGDVGEFVEVRVAAGTDVMLASIEAYNGNGGGLYNSFALNGSFASSDGTFDYYVVNTPGLQNGSPDGLALVNDGAVVEFLSYEGSLTATSGTAVGLTSTDVGVSEPGSTPVGQSLQRNEDGTWRAPEEETRGFTNDGPVPFAGRLNELHYDNAGGDVGEFIEVRVETGADVSLASVELYNGNGGGNYATFGLTGNLSSSDGTFDYYVIDTPGIQNGPDGFALINDGAVLEFLSYEDSFTASDGTAMGLTSTDIGVAETGSTPVGESLQRDAEGNWQGPSAETRGAANDGGGTAPETTLISAIQGTGGDSTFVGQQVTVSAIVTRIVDGSGFFLQEEDADADADAGTSEGIFVFTGGGTAVALGDLVEVSGSVSEFFGKTQISSVSATNVISSGNIAPTAAQIMLDPAVAQDFEAVEGMLVTISSGTTDPLTVIENFNLDRFGEITISAGRQTQPTQLFDAQDEAAEVAALAEGNLNNRIAIDDGLGSQNPSQFEFLPGGAGDNGNGFLDSGDDFGDAGTTLRLGSELTADVQGVLDFSFGEFKVLTTERLQIDEATNVGERDAAPADVGGDLQVASFNVLNYFTTFSGNTLGGVGVRGADNQDELDRQTSKIVQAMEGTGADVFALQELENGGFAEGAAIDALVDALNEQVNPGGTGGPFAFANPTGVTVPGDPGGLIGTDAITTGIVFDQTKVRLVHTEFKVFEEASAAVTFALADVLNQVASSDDQVGDFQRNRPSVAATFEELDSDGNGTGNVFTVVSSHFKSKGDSNLQDVVLDAQAHVDGGGTTITQADIDALIADPNFDQGDGQAFWNQVRTDASVELLEWIETEYNGGGVTNYVLLGDLNAYAEEDPVDALTDAGLVDLIDLKIGQDQAYSFVFDGQQGTLDQGVSDASFAGFVTGAAEWHINADEPDLINYDTDFNDPAFFNDGVYGASDHDPLIIGLDFTPEPILG